MKRVINNPDYSFFRDRRCQNERSIMRICENGIEIIKKDVNKQEENAKQKTEIKYYKNDMNTTPKTKIKYGNIVVNITKKTEKKSLKKIKSIEESIDKCIETPINAIIEKTERKFVQKREGKAGRQG